MLLTLWARWLAPWIVCLRPLYIFLRPMIKWFIKKVTGKCELLRLTLQYPFGAERTLGIGKNHMSGHSRKLVLGVSDQL